MRAHQARHAYCDRQRAPIVSPVYLKLEKKPKKTELSPDADFDFGRQTPHTFFCCDTTLTDAGITITPGHTLPADSHCGRSSGPTVGKGRGAKPVGERG